MARAFVILIHPQALALATPSGKIALKPLTLAETTQLIRYLEATRLQMLGAAALTAEEITLLWQASGGSPRALYAGLNNLLAPDPA